MGTLNRVYMRFPKPFWATTGTELLGYIAERKGEWAEGYSVHGYTGAPILMLFNAGAFGVAIERLSNEAIVAQSMEVLRKMFGNSIPSPEASLVTRWASDPFALGSYSYAATGASLSDYVQIAEPVGNRLYFAGEATSSLYPATVHGAYLSGLREARRIEGKRV